eukprot:CAMPEP_0119384372 /NCGR_PEP_ID=MMETSP1334-20130426/85195_1 /TAXON_ID=127549 /ORGANISM="Calcidiscus leptoporus, Strain RCC1130" /LENGTH=232 /DNA_ID=CAMNT_0007405383 /DNA_START=130 /DNA_END=824 /DNA_ORIENTATION=-
MANVTAPFKYVAVIDWSHYAPAPRVETRTITSVSVGDMYWQVVSPIRAQELVLDRNALILHREHGPFSHIRRKMKKEKAADSKGQKAEALEPQGSMDELLEAREELGLETHETLDEAPRKASAVREKAEKKPGSKQPVERIIYKTEQGEEFEVTADRKRKLADISSALGNLKLCPLLVRIWERDGSPITSATALCTCRPSAVDLRADGADGSRQQPALMEPPIKREPGTELA